MAFDLVDDVCTLLVASLATVTIKAELASDVDNCIAVIQTGGYDPVHTFGPQKPAFIQPGFQIVCRHLNELTLKTWWDSIKTVLDGKANYTPSGKSCNYMIIQQSGDVNSLGRDDNRRHLESLNFDTMVSSTY